MDEQQKICTKCDIIKPLEAYRKVQRGKLGRAAICRQCQNEHNRQWRKKTAEAHDPTKIPEFKVCGLCKQNKPASEFTRIRQVKDGLHTYCKKCYNARQLAQRHQFLSELYKIKESKPCPDCGRKYPSWMMQFDHLPGTEKAFMVSAGLGAGAGGRSAIREEIKKCEVVCASCHLNRTYWRRQGVAEADIPKYPGL